MRQHLIGFPKWRCTLFSVRAPLANFKPKPLVSSIKGLEASNSDTIALGPDTGETGVWGSYWGDHRSKPSTEEAGIWELATGGTVDLDQRLQMAFCDFVWNEKRSEYHEMKSMSRCQWLGRLGIWGQVLDIPSVYGQLPVQSIVCIYIHIYIYIYSTSRPLLIS